MKSPPKPLSFATEERRFDSVADTCPINSISVSSKVHAIYYPYKGEALAAAKSPLIIKLGAQSRVSTLKRSGKIAYPIHTKIIKRSVRDAFIIIYSRAVPLGERVAAIELGAAFVPKPYVEELIDAIRLLP
ncbi:MAG: hypothetical protein M3362_11785 [Acidobacteriota bacterium]|nr:hypothetical protein [Acidobacteriota bacterium]